MLNCDIIKKYKYKSNCQPLISREVPLNMITSRPIWITLTKKTLWLADCKKAWRALKMKEKLITLIE